MRLDLCLRKPVHGLVASLSSHDCDFYFEPSNRKLTIAKPDVLVISPSAPPFLASQPRAYLVLNHCLRAIDVPVEGPRDHVHGHGLTGIDNFHGHDLTGIDTLDLLFLSSDHQRDFGSHHSSPCLCRRGEGCASVAQRVSSSAVLLQPHPKDKRDFDLSSLLQCSSLSAIA